MISFVIGFLTVCAGWIYGQIELWLANGFLKWYIWKVARIIAKKLDLQKQPTPISGLGLSRAWNGTSPSPVVSIFRLWSLKLNLHTFMNCKSEAFTWLAREEDAYSEEKTANT